MNTSNVVLRYLAELIILDNQSQVKSDPDRAKKEKFEELMQSDQEYIDKLIQYYNKKYANLAAPEAHP